MPHPTIRTTKLDAARRQLATAIELWFNEGDPVSIHTLSAAAYEILHVISKKRDSSRRDLLFDTLAVKDEYLDDWNRRIKQPANSFKHAMKEEAIEFDPEISVVFILFAVLAVELCGEAHNEAEVAFIFWFQFHRPELLTEKGREFSSHLSTDQLASINAIPRQDFFKAIVEARGAKASVTSLVSARTDAAFTQ